MQWPAVPQLAASGPPGPTRTESLAMNPSDHPAAPPGSPLSAEDRLRAGRRAAILGGLGKGSVALAAMSPLASQAVNVRSHKLANGMLPGGFGYCTISGFQSAAISGAAAATVCSAYAPEHFVNVETLVYSGPGANLTITGPIDAQNLSVALNSKYGVSKFTSTNVAPLLSATAPMSTAVIVAGSTVVLIWTSSNSAIALTRRNWPVSAGLGALAAFNASPRFIASADSRPLVLVLYDGVLSANPPTANCWFLSAYLTVFNSTPSTLPSGFDKTYLTSSYESASAGSDVYAFLKTLCTAP